MSQEETAGWLGLEKRLLKERARKMFIVLVLLGSLWPSLSINIGINAKNAGLSGPVLGLNYPNPAFGAVLLCQVWALFASISPFNYTMHYEVQLTDGRVIALHDFKKEAAGKWQSILYHNEPKAELNMYSDRIALRHYMEYLIWSNGITQADVVRRTIFIRYRNVNSRAQAAVAGTYFQPEAVSVIENY